METVFADAAVWVARRSSDQNLAGYDFVQWPSRGTPSAGSSTSRRGNRCGLIRTGDVTISRIGELCKNSTNYAANVAQFQNRSALRSCGVPRWSGGCGSRVRQWPSPRVDDFSFSDAGVISVVITPQWAGGNCRGGLRPSA